MKMDLRTGRQNLRVDCTAAKRADPNDVSRLVSELRLEKNIVSPLL